MERPGPRHIISRRDISPIVYEKKKDDCIVYRGLYDKEVYLKRKRKFHVIPGYVSELPGFRGEDVEEVVDRKIKESGKARILDVGSGNARFLLQSAHHWGNRVNLSGITSYPYHEENLQRKINRLPKKATSPEIERLGIKIAVGNAQNLRRELKLNNIDEGFDVVVSVYCLNYLDDPFAALKQINQVLNMGGVGLVKSYRMFSSVTPEDRGPFRSFLQDVYGMEVDDDSISFEKKQDHLQLPLSYGVDDQGYLKYKYA